MLRYLELGYIMHLFFIAVVGNREYDRENETLDNFDRDKIGNGKGMGFRGLWRRHDSIKVSRERYHKRSEEISKTTSTLSAFGIGPD